MEIGQVHEIPEFENKIKELTTDWSNQAEEGKKTNLSKITFFLLSSVDILVCTIDGMLEKGIDKKATVLMGMEKLYDFVSASALIPLWLKPFLNVSKSYIIYTLISIFIDWMVAKYREGSWKTKKETSFKKSQKRTIERKTKKKN